MSASLLADSLVALVLAYRSDDIEFHEADHPRDEEGKFTAGAGKRGALHQTKTIAAKRVQASGEALPAHIEKLRIPPAWTDVRFSHQPDADLLVVGRDSKGRTQAIYSEAFSRTQAAAKFARIEELGKKYDAVQAQNARAQASSDPPVRDSADCLALVMAMGIRPGSDRDTGAEKQAFGATTLRAEHVVLEGGKVSLRFTGKKGVALNLPVTDRKIAAMLLARAQDAGEDGRLFPATSDKLLLDHVHSLDGGGFKTKDFRTLVGTQTAMEMVRAAAVPTDPKSYKKAVMAVAKQVAQRLGNTPVIALQSYISPTVFAEWRAASGL